MKYLLLFVLALPIWAYGYPMVPEDDFTTGSLCTEEDTDFEEYRYEEEIPYCERRVSASLKARIYAEYKIPKTEWQDYTIDHFIPLSLGGTNHSNNLWPENKAVKALRPGLEMELFIALRDGKISQKQAVDTVIEKKLNPLGAEHLGPPPH